ncbi:MAG: serine hydrolase domain-containing protein [Blastocatellia bacterium]
MKKVWSLLLALVLPVMLVPAFAYGSTRKADKDLDGLRKRVQSKVDEMRASAELPGITVGFVLADGRSVSVSSGFADVENKTPLSPDDLMLAGSIGKTYFAAVTLQLVSEGKLKLDEKIERWLGREAWFDSLPNARDITLRMLMNHTSGIPEHVLDKDFIAAMRANPDRVWKPAELVAYILDAKPLFPAGQGWSYADTNYIVVGIIVEKVTGKNFYAEVERRILKPLALKHTRPSVSRNIPGLVTGYSRPDSPFGFAGRTIVDGRFIINPQMEWTGGGFVSTAEDLARWAKALYEGRVLKKELLAEMLTPVDAAGGRGGGSGNKYGLAVQIRQSEWGASYGHGGWFPGYLSEMEYFPDHKVAIAVQVNTDASASPKKNLRVYIADIARIVLGDQTSRKAAPAR